jgi:hypothetical protein
MRHFWKRAEFSWHRRIQDMRAFRGHARRAFTWAPITPKILEIARGVIWFEPPEQALSDPVRFMAYAMTYATPEDMRAIRKHVSDDDFREALERAPPGIIDPRSWAYWNSKMGRYPAPPDPFVGSGARPKPWKHGKRNLLG